VLHVAHQSVRLDPAALGHDLCQAASLSTEVLGGPDTDGVPADVLDGCFGQPHGTAHAFERLIDLSGVQLLRQVVTFADAPEEITPCQAGLL